MGNIKSKLLTALFITYSIALSNEKDYELLIQDPLSLISTNLKGPSSENSRIMFWMKVYDQWNENKLIVHDKLNLNIVYGVFDLQQFYISGKSNKTIASDISKYTSSKVFEVSEFLRGFKKTTKRPTWMPKDTYQNLVISSNRRLSTLSNQVRSQRGLKNGFKKALSFSHPYFLDMEKIFVSKGLHPHLTRISLIESMFNPYSKSKSGAMGVWQIMPEIQNAFLNTKTSVDERIDPIKSTYAAAELLKENLLLLNNKTPLAVVAYNQGVTEIRKHHKAPKFNNDPFKFLSKFQSDRFKFSGQNYYYEYLAALYLQLYEDVEISSLSKKPSLASTLDTKSKQYY